MKENIDNNQDTDLPDSAYQEVRERKGIDIEGLQFYVGNSACQASEKLYQRVRMFAITLCIAKACLNNKNSPSIHFTLKRKR